MDRLIHVWKLWMKKSKIYEWFDHLRILKNERRFLRMKIGHGSFRWFFLLALKKNKKIPIFNVLLKFEKNMKLNCKFFSNSWSSPNPFSQVLSVNFMHRI